MNILNDEDPTGKIVFNPIMITTIVMNCLIILIVIYLVFLYIKSKELHSFFKCLYINFKYSNLN